MIILCHLLRCFAFQNVDSKHTDSAACYNAGSTDRATARSYVIVIIFILPPTLYGSLRRAFSVSHLGI